MMIAERASWSARCLSLACVSEGVSLDLMNTFTKRENAAVY